MVPESDSSDATSSNSEDSTSGSPFFLRVLIDTNVVLDWLLDRRPWSDAAKPGGVPSRGGLSQVKSQVVSGDSLLGKHGVQLARRFA